MISKAVLKAREVFDYCGIEDTICYFFEGFDYLS